MLRVSAASRNSSANSASEAYSAKGSPLQRAVQNARKLDTDFSAWPAMRPSIVEMRPHGPAASHITRAVTCVQEIPPGQERAIINSYLGREALHAKLETPLPAAAHVITTGTCACKCQHQRV